MLTAMRYVTLALLAGLGTAQAATPDPELNAIAAKMKARHIEVDKLQRLSPHLVELTIKGERVYTTADGDIMLFGQAVQFDKDNRPTNLSTAANWEQVQDMIQSGRAVTYKATHEKASLAVFTDFTCGYCQKLHEQIGELNSRGVSVSYLPYPRSGPNSPSFEQMQAAWCEKDVKRALSSLFGGAQMPARSCANADAVNEGWALGQKVQLQGTPTLMTPGGQIYTGYMSVPDILKLLGI